MCRVGPVLHPQRACPSIRHLDDTVMERIRQRESMDDPTMAGCGSKNAGSDIASDIFSFLVLVAGDVRVEGLFRAARPCITLTRLACLKILLRRL